MKAAVWMQGAIVNHNPAAKIAKKANLKKWANEFRIMREQDGLTILEIGDILGWLFDPAHPDFDPDPFWRLVIQSPTKFRAKWDQLTAKRHAPRKGGYR